MNFSIIIVTSNRKNELQRCLDSIFYCKTQYHFEVIIVFNGDSSYCNLIKEHYPKILTLEIPAGTPARARNMGLEMASGQYLFFLDDDCVLPPNYFDEIHLERDLDVFGGPDQTPPHSSPLQTAIGDVLSSPLCAGPTFFRHSKNTHYTDKANEKYLSLCNLWFKKSLFKDEKFNFHTELVRNEENYLLKILTHANKSIHYSPQIFVYHQRRNSLRQLGKTVSRSGEFRVNNIFLFPTFAELVYCAPLFSIFIFFINDLYFVYGVFTHIVLTTIFSIIKYKKINFLFIALHYYILTAYAVGNMIGLTKIILKRFQRPRLLK